MHVRDASRPVQRPQSSDSSGPPAPAQRFRPVCSGLSPVTGSATNRDSSQSLDGPERDEARLSPTYGGHSIARYHRHAPPCCRWVMAKVVEGALVAVTGIRPQTWGGTCRSRPASCTSDPVEISDSPPGAGSLLFGGPRHERPNDPGTLPTLRAEVGAERACRRTPRPLRPDLALVTRRAVARLRWQGISGRVGRGAEGR